MTTISSMTILPGVVSVLNMAHKITNKKGGGGIRVTLVDQADLVKVIENNSGTSLSSNFCKKDKLTGIQRKFSCNLCRMIFESVDTLEGHLAGGKHKENLQNTPVDLENFFLHVNGQWKKNKGEKRGLEFEETRKDKLSKRERTKVNKLARNISIPAQQTEAKYLETETYFEAGLRKVRPYYFTFTTHTKEKWVGDSLFDVFSREFRALPPDQYEHGIKEGLVTVNEKMVSPDYKVQHNDLISHKVHRHEMPVTDIRINILAETEDLVVVDKPASIPVHPCGRYRHNTVLFILAKENGLRNLLPVHRLDRLTSGVLIFSKTAAKAREFEQVIKARQVEKEYVCCVIGEFPEGVVTCDQPLDKISCKIGVCVVDKKGKECSTTFKRLAYKDGVSVVQCMPKSGRMHQIRVHLQYLGYPIDNDPLYNSTIFGADKGRHGVLGKSKEQLVEDLIRHQTVDNVDKSDEFPEDDSKLKLSSDQYSCDKINISDVNLSSDKVVDDSKIADKSDSHVNIGTSDCKITNEMSSSESIKESSDRKLAVSDVTNQVSVDTHYYDPNCYECMEKTMVDPSPATLVMHLHALRYSGDGWTYHTDMPQWTKL